MFGKALLISSVLATFASAQTIVTSSAASVAASTTVSQSMPPSATSGFNPAAVNETIRYTWCQAQLHSCPEICGGSAAVNSCQETSLTYSCVCANGTVPDCTAYSQTLPFYICEQTYIQCVANNPDNAAGQQQCTANEQCGTLNSTAQYLSASSASHSTTGSSTRSSSGSGSATAATTSASATHNAAAYREVGTGVFIAGLMAAARLVL